MSEELKEELNEKQLNQSNEKQLEQSKEEKNEEGKRQRRIDEKPVTGTPVTDKKRRTKQRTAQRTTPYDKTVKKIKDAMDKVKGVNQSQQETLFDVFVADLKMPPRNEKSIDQYLIEQTPATVTGHETLRQLIQDWVHSCAPLIFRAKKLSMKHQQEILAQMTELAKTLRKHGYNEESITQTLMKGPQNDATLIQQVIENLK